jgi:hypothetical protein
VVSIIGVFVGNIFVRKCDDVILVFWGLMMGLCWGFLIFCVVTLLPFKPLLIVRFVCMFADVPPPLPRWFDRLRHLRCCHYWSFGCCSLREVCISLRIVALCLSL